MVHKDSKRRMKFRKSIINWFLLTLAVITLINIGRYHGIQNFSKTSSTVVQSQSILQNHEYLSALLSQAESATRSYIITGEEHYLRPYHTAAGLLPQVFSDLRRLTADRAQELAKLNELQSLIQDRLDLFDKEIALMKNRGFAAAREFTLTDTGETSTRKISSLLRELDHQEHNALTNLLEDTRSSMQNAYLMVLLGSSFSFVVFFLVFFFLNRENNRRKSAEKKLRDLNAELEERVQKRTAQLARKRDELAVRARVMAQLIEKHDIHSQMKAALNAIIEFLGVEFGCIHLVQDHNVVLEQWHGISDDCRAAMLSFPSDNPPDFIRKYQVIHEGLSKRHDMPDYAVQEGIQAWITIPLVLQAREEGKPDEWLGSIIVASPRSDAISEEDVETLQVMAKPIALAIDRARFCRLALGRLNRLRVLREIDKGIIQQVDLREILHIVLNKMPKDLGADAAAISLFAKNKTFAETCAFRCPDGVIIDEEVFSIADSLQHWFKEKQENVIIYDMSQDPRLQVKRELIRNGKLFSYLGVPLIVRNETIGVLHIMTRKPHNFIDEDVEFFHTLAGQTAIAIHNARSTEQLRKSEKQYRSLFEESKDAVFISTREGKILDMNPAGIEIFGYDSKDEILEIDIPGDLYCNTREREEFVRLMEAQGFVKNLGMVLKRKDGQKLNMLNTSTALHDDEGNIIAYRGILRDETERIKTTKFIKNILESVGEGIIVVDDQYKILSANKAYAQQQNMAPADIIGQYCHKVSHHMDMPCFRAGTDCPVRHTFKTGEPYSTQHTHKNSQGDPVFIEVQSFPMKDSEGNIISVIEMINDITEKKKLEQQLIQAQKMEAVGQLSGGIAHDFNNILTVISGYGGLIKRSVKADNPLWDYADKILYSSTRAAELTKSLLAFSRKQIMKMQPVSLNELVTKTKIFLSRIIGEDINLETILAQDEIIVMVDTGQIEQVLMNLTANARDAMPNGGLLSLETRVVDLDEADVKKRGYGTPGCYALISISDSGCGMDEATRTKIFEPFFTTKETGKGTGLGLSMAYGIIKQHNGYINIYSEPDRGSTFKIYLPVVMTNRAGDHQESDLSAAPKGTEVILYAEDDADVRKLTADSLRELGYTIIEAEDGEEAVKRFMEHKDAIQLLLLDVIMPKKDGKDAYNEINGIAPGIKTIFLSGHTANLIHKKGMLDEGLNLITKPYSITDLTSTVRELLDT